MPDHERPQPASEPASEPPAATLDTPLVVAYGDANAMRRGVAHAVLRDVLLHGPLAPGDDAPALADDPEGWVEAYAAVRGEFIGAAFEVPAEAAAAHVATPLKAVLAAPADRAVEVVVDAGPCIDCALAVRLVASVATAGGVAVSAVAADGGSWEEAEQVRAPHRERLVELSRTALWRAATRNGSVEDAWRVLHHAAGGMGVADLGACIEFRALLEGDEPPARLLEASPGELVPACAEGRLAELRLAGA